MLQTNPVAILAPKILATIWPARSACLYDRRSDEKLLARKTEGLDRKYGPLGPGVEQPLSASEEREFSLKHRCKKRFYVF